MPVNTHITSYYNITGPVPFLDVDVAADKPMFVDPRAVRLSPGPQPFSAAAERCMETFFHEVTRCVLSTLPADRRHGLDLLQHFAEPWETRLGHAAAGFQGRGGAQDVGAWIWQALESNLRMLVQVGFLTQLEDIPLFVDHIAEDITSDLTTRIIFAPLSEYTADMVSRHPEFTAGTHSVTTVRRRVWDPTNLRWITVAVELPVAYGKPLLLVPRDWARGTLLMHAGRFYDTKVLGFAQMEQATRSRRGKLIKPSKDTLREQAALARGRDTILQVVLRAHAKGENLLDVFKAFVDTRYMPLEDDVVERKLA